MARRKLSMNEYLEMVYQWHRGRSVRQIRDSLKMSRKTIHKYLRRLAEEGLSREQTLPEEEQLAQLVASVVKSAVFEQPARERTRPYHQQIIDCAQSAGHVDSTSTAPARGEPPAGGQLHERASLRTQPH